MSALTLLEAIYMKLQQRCGSEDYAASRIVDHILTTPMPPPIPAQTVSAIEVTELTSIKIPDHVMIHEMLKRGYAVQKIPTP